MAETENKIEIELIGKPAKRYRVRTTGKNGSSYETTLPREVVEKEAEARGMKVSEFIRDYIAVIRYDDFPGVHIAFEREEKS